SEAKTTGTASERRCTLEGCQNQLASQKRSVRTKSRVGLPGPADVWHSLRGAHVICDGHRGSPLRFDPRLLSGNPPGWPARALNTDLCGARPWLKTQPQRVAEAQGVRTCRGAAVGAPHTAALRFANLRQVHSPKTLID